MLHRRRSTDQACFDNRSMLADFFYDMLVTPANISGRHLLHLVVCMGLLKLEHKSDDTGILDEVDVGDMYNARGVQFTCKLIFLLRIVQ
jgi:hypothetical protein